MPELRLAVALLVIYSIELESWSNEQVWSKVINLSLHEGYVSFAQTVKSRYVDGMKWPCLYYCVSSKG